MATEGLAGIDADAEAFEEIVVDLGDVTGDADGDQPGPQNFADGETPHEPLPPAEAYEELEPILWAWGLASIRDDVTHALFALEDAVVEDRRRPTAREVRKAREALETAETLVDHYAELAVDP